MKTLLIPLLLLSLLLTQVNAETCTETGAETCTETGAETGAETGGFLPNEVDKDEITRRGEWVEQVGIIQAEDQQQHSIEAAFQTPPDDSNKWYIAVISSKGCKYCDKLKYDFANDSTLQAWVNVNEPIKSWAHYQLYQWEDTSQRDRFSQIRIKGFPTLIIQPPRNGEFGSNATVVWQKTGYDGNAEKLSQEMSNAIKRYVAAINNERQRNPKEFVEENISSEELLKPDESKKFSATPETEQVRASGAVPLTDTIGTDPPFTIPNRDDYDGHNREIPPEVTGKLTKNELKDLLPSANEEFINELHIRGVNKEEALRAWSLYKKPFNSGNMVHYIFVGGGVLFILFCFIIFLVIAFVAIRYAWTHILAKEPPVIKEREVIHEKAFDLEKVKAELRAELQQQNKPAQQSNQQSNGMIL